MCHRFHFYFLIFLIRSIGWHQRAKSPGQNDPYVSTNGYRNDLFVILYIFSSPRKLHLLNRLFILNSQSRMYINIHKYKTYTYVYIIVSWRRKTLVASQTNCVAHCWRAGNRFGLFCVSFRVSSMDPVACAEVLNFRFLRVAREKE